MPVDHFRNVDLNDFTLQLHGHRIAIVFLDMHQSLHNMLVDSQCVVHGCDRRKSAAGSDMFDDASQHSFVCDYHTMVDFHRIRLPCDGVTVIRLSPTANDVIPAYFEGPRRRVYMQYHIDDNTRGITAIVVSRELMRAIREMDQSRSRDLQKVIVCGLDRSSKVADNESILSGTIDALKQMKKHVAAVRQRR